MNLVEMLQNGGLGAYAAVALGMLGGLVGVVALLMSLSKSRAGFSLGLVSMVFATASAGAGILGTMMGRTQTQNALAYVSNAIDAERIGIAGWREASFAALFGFFGALVPFMLGGAAAVVAARLPSGPRRKQGEPELVETHGNSSRIVVAMIFSGVGLISIGGAWVLWHQAPTPGRYNFLPEDDGAWQLAAAIEDVNADKEESCSRLERELDAYWGADDTKEWPRQMRTTPPSSLEWKAAAKRCVERRLEKDDDVAALLTSALLHDDELRAKVQTHGAIPSLPPPGDEGLDKDAIATVVRAARKTVQNCYERGLVKKPKLAGKVEIQFTISGRGDVSEANSDAHTTLDDAHVVSCIREAIERLKFPAPRDGQPVTVSYPFVLNPAP